MPLEGPRRFDSTFVNRTAGRIFDRLAEGCSVANILEDLHTTYPEVPADRLQLDVFKALLTFETYGLCKLSLEDYKLLLAQPEVLPGQLQFMSPALAEDVAAVLRGTQGIGPRAGQVRNLYSLRPLDPGLAAQEDGEQVMLRHIRGTEVYFVLTDGWRHTRAVVGLTGPSMYGPVQQIALLAGESVAPEGFCDLMKQALIALEATSRTLPGVTKTRFAFVEDPCADRFVSGFAADEFDSVVGNVGYRREAVFRNEFGSNQSVVLYSKLIR